MIVLLLSTIISKPEVSRLTQISRKEMGSR